MGTIDVKYINPFIISTVETFEKMIGEKAEKQKLYIKEKDEVSDVTGIIGLSGDAKGIIAISFPRLSALRIVSKFLGSKVLSVDETVSDAVGELVNIIAGNAKQYLEGLNVSISLPKVITGPSHTINEMKEIPTIVIPFKTNLGEFKIEVAMKME